MSRNKDENMNGRANQDIANEQDKAQAAGEAPGQEAGTQEQTYVLTQAQFDEMKARIEEITSERDEMKNLAQRVQADFDNFRRRNSSVRADSLDEGVRNTILALLPAYDSLELALSAAKEDNSPLAEGLRLVYRQFSDAFSKLGMTPIEAVDKPFDPVFHDAVMQCRVECAESGTVVEEFQKGYMLKDRVIRHSMVKVSE